MFIKNKKYLGFLFLYLINFNNFSFNNFFSNNIKNTKSWVCKHKLAICLIAVSVLLVLDKTKLNIFYKKKKVFRGRSRTKKIYTKKRKKIKVDTFCEHGKKTGTTCLSCPFNNAGAYQCIDGIKLGKRCKFCGGKVATNYRKKALLNMIETGVV